MTDTTKQPERKLGTHGESVLLAPTPNDQHREVIEFLHAVKGDYGSAANAARVAIRNWDVYQDWKEAKTDEITAARTRSPNGQFVAGEEQKCVLAQ